MNNPREEYVNITDLEIYTKKYPKKYQIRDENGLCLFINIAQNSETSTLQESTTEYYNLKVSAIVHSGLGRVMANTWGELIVLQMVSKLSNGTSFIVALIYIFTGTIVISDKNNKVGNEGYYAIAVLSDDRSTVIVILQTFPRFPPNPSEELFRHTQAFMQKNNY